MKTLITFVVGVALLCSAPSAQSQSQAQAPKVSPSPQLKGPASADRGRTTALIVDEVRHELVMLPYYGVFDWLEGQVMPDDTVELRGEVSRPSTKSEAVARVKKLERVAKVVDKIEVLPVSQFDDQIRRQVYRAIYNFDSPLFQYAVRAVPPIHIIVKGGRVTLKGAVLSDMDRQLAETYARQVPSVMEVKNELMVDKPTEGR